MLNILLVDDSLIIRRSLRKIFEDVGHTIVNEAKDGMDGYVKYQKHLPDLVTMDITMPDMDGITSVKKIIAEYPQAKIIMITSHGQENMVIDAIKAGAKGYILKPLNKDKILEIIESIFGIEHSQLIIEQNKAQTEKQKENIEYFYIENRVGIFVVKIKTKYKTINKEIMIEIEEYIENLFIIRPLNIIFDFEGIENINDSAFEALFELINKINQLDLNIITKLYIPSAKLRELFNIAYEKHQNTKVKLLNSIS